MSARAKERTLSDWPRLRIDANGSCAFSNGWIEVVSTPEGESAAEEVLAQAQLIFLFSAFQPELPVFGLLPEFCVFPAGLGLYGRRPGKDPE